MLGPVHAHHLTENSRMTILDGELGDTATMDLPDETLQMLKASVHIVIHAAASIQLKNSLRELSYTVIAPTLCLTQYALKFPNLEKFVLLSTAYANAHLWTKSTLPDVAVEERVYPLTQDEDRDKNRNSQDPYDSAPNAWRQVQATGSSDEYDAHDFPWPYAYAKHLAERLVLRKAAEKNAQDKILIVRPSVVGPADQYPYHGFTTAYSTPSTACAAAYALHPGRKIVLASRCENPSRDATVDEVPVDVVADRLLVHTALGMSGCVHAVSGIGGRLRIEEWLDAFREERRLPWAVRPVWTAEGWHSKGVHHVAREFKIIGTSFAFAEGKTVDVAARLGVGEREGLNLFADRSEPYSLVQRRVHIHRLARQMSRKMKWPACSARLLCRRGKAPGVPLHEPAKRKRAEGGRYMLE